jgi:hypothetical protein
MSGSAGKELSPLALGVVNFPGEEEIILKMGRLPAHLYFFRDAPLFICLFRGLFIPGKKVN